MSRPDAGEVFLPRENYMCSGAEQLSLFAGSSMLEAETTQHGSRRHPHRSL
jgi:hypothetical protein